MNVFYGWDEPARPPGWDEVEFARCRGCPQDITRPVRPEGVPPAMWEDSNGIMVCVKATSDDAREGRYVLHEPMPVIP